MKVKAPGTKVTLGPVDVGEVKAMKISYQTVYFMPEFEASFARQMLGLKVTDCYMKSIEKDDLRQFPDLTHLDLSDNEIEWLDDDLFEFSSKVRIVNFDANRISMIGARTWEPLKNLQVIFFIRNECLSTLAYTNSEILELQAKFLTQCAYDSEIIEEKKRKLEEEFPRMSDVQVKESNCGRNFVFSSHLLLFVIFSVFALA